MVYVVPRRTFGDSVDLVCAIVDRTLDSLLAHDPDLKTSSPTLDSVARSTGQLRADLRLGRAFLRAARLTRLDLRLSRAAQALAVGSAVVSATDQAGPLSAPDGTLLVGTFRIGVTYTVAQIPFASGIMAEQPVAIAEVHRSSRICSEGLF